MTRKRLHVFMAKCGAGSRRECETYIAERRVTVNGEVVDKPGSLVAPDEDEVCFDGTKLKVERIVHYLLNKPRGVVCSARGAPRAIDYAPPEAEDLRLFTIGRLDVDSEGAIILTNDGDLTHLVSHPRFEVEKTYRVEVTGNPTDETLDRLRKGVWLSEGKTGGAHVHVVKRMRGRSILEVALQEGRHREVRRVCARLGHEVARLVRTRIGTVMLGRLDTGHVRRLRPDEIEALRKSARVVIRLGSTPPAMKVARALRKHHQGSGGGRHGGKAGARPGGRGRPSGKTSAGKPAARPGKPGARPGKPGARPGKPGARPGKPGARPGKPGARPGKPGARPARPGKPGGRGRRPG